MNAIQYERIAAAIDVLEQRTADAIQKEAQGNNQEALLYIYQKVQDIKKAHAARLEPDPEPKKKLCINCIHIKQGQEFRHRGRGKYMHFHRKEYKEKEQ